MTIEKLFIFFFAIQFSLENQRVPDWDYLVDLSHLGHGKFGSEHLYCVDF